MVLCTVLVILVYKDGWACALYMAWNLLSWQSSNEKIVLRATKLVTLVSWGVVLCLLLLLFCQRKVSVPLLPPKPSICSAHRRPSPSIVSFTLYLLNHSWQLCSSWHLSLIPSYHLVKKKWGAVASLVLLSLPEGQAENEHLSSEQLFPNRECGLVSSTHAAALVKLTGMYLQWDLHWASKLGQNWSTGRMVLE